MSFERIDPIMFKLTSTIQTSNLVAIYANPDPEVKTFKARAVLALVVWADSGTGATAIVPITCEGLGNQNANPTFDSLRTQMPYQILHSEELHTHLLAMPYEFVAENGHGDWEVQA